MFDWLPLPLVVGQILQVKIIPRLFFARLGPQFMNRSNTRGYSIGHLTMGRTKWSFQMVSLWVNYGENHTFWQAHHCWLISPWSLSFVTYPNFAANVSPVISQFHHFLSSILFVTIPRLGENEGAMGIHIPDFPWRNPRNSGGKPQHLFPWNPPCLYIPMPHVSGKEIIQYYQILSLTYSPFDMHTYIHTYLPTYLHTYIHTHIYIYIYNPNTIILFYDLVYGNNTMVNWYVRYIHVKKTCLDICAYLNLNIQTIYMYKYI